MYRAIAYVTVPASENWRWIGKDGEEVVSGLDTRYVTQANFAFGSIRAYQFEEGKEGCPLKEGRIASPEAYKDPADGKYHYKATLEGWIEEMDTRVDGRKYVRALVDLKKQNPDFKVLVSIGGWDSDGFCYMAGTEEGRKEFIESCVELVKEYQLDGIDIDWEFPNNGAWGEIASCEHCVEHARLLMKEFRKTFEEEFQEEHKLLTIACGMYQPWADQETLDVLDYINVMCYDYEPGSGESQAGMQWVREGMKMNTDSVGDTPQNRQKINLGVPFYNEGGEYLVPYCKEWNGYVDASPEIIEEKMNWVKEEGYGGGFYWAYSMDVFEEDVEDPADKRVKCLQRAVYETLNGQA